MPLTEKGSKIMAAMKEQYGPERGEEVFYSSKNAGTITGVDTDQGPFDPGRLREEEDTFMPGELTRREEEHDQPPPRVEPKMEYVPQRSVPEDAGALLSASGSPGHAARRDDIPWDCGWRGGDGPFGARVRDWTETYTFEQGTDSVGRDDEYAAPGAEQQREDQPQSATGDQPANIGTLPEGSVLDPALEHPQEFPGESTPPSRFPGDAAPGTTGGLQKPFGDANIGYGGIAGGVFKQDWGDRGPHPFMDQLPSGMTTNEIQNWGRNHYWKQWER